MDVSSGCLCFGCAHMVTGSPLKASHSTLTIENNKQTDLQLTSEKEPTLQKFRKHSFQVSRNLVAPQRKVSALV